MSAVTLHAQLRTEIRKGASRRLRRLENQIPAVVYGGHKKPVIIQLSKFKVAKALENESIFSSVFDLHIDDKVEHVILKALQRHPYKAQILHMDFQRVSKHDILVKMIPLHFINEEKAPGVKVGGGVVHHFVSQVELRCEAQYLPEFIEVDLAKMQLDEVFHLSHLKLPKHVTLAVDPEGDHDHPVVSIHIAKVNVVEEDAPETTEVPTVSDGEDDNKDADSSDESGA
jgi:large subunit ribosomal protein L25